MKFEVLFIYFWIRISGKRRNNDTCFVHSIKSKFTEAFYNNIVLTSSNRCGYEMCLLVLPVCSACAVQFSATVTCGETSGKERIYTLCWFRTAWNIFKRYCKSKSLKQMYCLSRYNLATLKLHVVFSLKSPSLTALFVATHGLAHSGQIFRHRLDLLIVEDEVGRHIFLQLQIPRRFVSLKCGTIRRRYMYTFGPVFIDQKVSN
jgi:hypothetical protein